MCKYTSILIGFPLKYDQTEDRILIDRLSIENTILSRNWTKTASWIHLFANECLFNPDIAIVCELLQCANCDIFWRQRFFFWKLRQRCMEIKFSKNYTSEIRQFKSSYWNIVYLISLKYVLVHVVLCGFIKRITRCLRAVAASMYVCGVYRLNVSSMPIHVAKHYHNIYCRRRL